MEKVKDIMKPTCEHLDWDNQRDCEKRAKYICQCCGMPVCEDHFEKLCPYGGMTYYEIEE